MNMYISAVSANFIFFVVNSIFFIVITPISLNVMGDELFGLWSILYAIVLLSNVGTLGIGSIVNKFASEEQKDQNAADYFSQVFTAGVLIVLPMATLVATILILARNLIATGLSIDTALEQQFSSTLVLIAIGLIPQFLSRVPQGFLLSQLKNRTARFIDTFSVISLWIGAVLIVLLFNQNLEMVGVWCLLNSCISMMLYFWAARDTADLRFQINLNVIWKMLNFSGFMFIESTATAMFQHLDKLIVGFTLGPVLAGVYAVGTSIGLRMSMVVGPVTEVLIPYASLRDSLREYEKLKIVFRRISKYVSLIVASIGGVAIIWMEDFLSLWISPDFAAQYTTEFRLLILAYSLLSLCRPAHQTLTGIGKVKVTSFIYSISTISMLMGLYFLSRYFGFLGATLANFVPVLLLVMNLYAYRMMTGYIAIKKMFEDLKWGIFLPTFLFVLVPFYSAFSLKLLTSIVLGSVLGIVLYRDVWARPWLINQFKHVVHKLFSYA